MDRDFVRDPEYFFYVTWCKHTKTEDAVVQYSDLHVSRACVAHERLEKKRLGGVSASHLGLRSEVAKSGPYVKQLPCLPSSTYVPPPPLPATKNISQIRLQTPHVQS